MGICDSAAWPEFVEWVRNFRGSFDGLKGFAKKFFEMADFRSGATIDVTFNRKAYSFGGADAKAVRDAILGVCGFVVRRRLAKSLSMRFWEYFAPEYFGPEKSLEEINRLIAPYAGLKTLIVERDTKRPMPEMRACLKGII